MPDLVVVLLDGAVGGEHAGLSDVDDLLLGPRLLIEVVIAEAALTERALMPLFSALFTE